MEEKTEETSKDIIAIEALFKAFISPSWWRRKLIKWIWPEIKEVAQKLQDYYWQ